MTEISAMGQTSPEGIGLGVWLQVVTKRRTVLSMPLIQAALHARAGQDLLPFVYRDPYDPDNPNAERPLRRARLVIIEDGTA